MPSGLRSGACAQRVKLTELSSLARDTLCCRLHADIRSPLSILTGDRVSGIIALRTVSCYWAKIRVWLRLSLLSVTMVSGHDLRCRLLLASERAVEAKIAQLAVGTLSFADLSAVVALRTWVLVGDFGSGLAKETSRTLLLVSWVLIVAVEASRAGLAS